MRYQCCIFDLDGTLVNSIYALERTINLTLEKFGLGFIDQEHTKKFVGDGYKKQVERSLVFCGDDGLTHYEEALNSYLEFFELNCMYQVEAYAGIRELLQFLKEREIKIAVLSNKPHERTVETVEKIFGPGYFDLVLGEREGIKRKPNPQGAVFLAHELGAETGKCLYFGDTNTDMETGIAAGMDTAGAAWGFRGRSELEKYRPTYLIDSPLEICKYISEEWTAVGGKRGL